MTLPGDLTTVTVTGTFASATGAPVTGTVTFTPSSTLLDPASQMVFPAAGAAYPLSAMGTFTSDPLIASDNEDLQPQGWSYVVKVELQDLQPYTFQTFLPSSPATVDLSALEPVSVMVDGASLPVVTPGSYLPTGGGTETGPVVFDYSPPFRIVGATSGQILVADSSGNFRPQDNTSGSANVIDGVTVSGTVAAAGRTIITTDATHATWQMPLQLDPSAMDVEPLAATASASVGGLQQAAAIDHQHPTTGLVVSGGAAGGDLGSTYPNPQVTATHLASPLPVLQGGTNSMTQNWVDLTTTQTGIGGNKTFTGTTTFSGEVVVPNLTGGSGANDAVPKSYADSIAVGLQVQAAANAATVGSESYTYTIVSGSVTTISSTTIDGVTLTSGQLVLVKDCPGTSGNTGVAGSSEPGNGLYLVSSASGTLSVGRATGMSGGNTPVAAFVFVEGGTVNKGAGYVVTTPAAGAWTSYGSGNIQWTQFSGGGGVTATAGLVLTGSTLSIENSGILTVAHGGTGTATTAPLNQVFAGPAITGAGAPAFRSLAAADLPAAGGDLSGTLAAATVAKIQGVAVTSAEATLVSDLNNATARAATATLLPGEETVFSGSAAAQTLTLPTSPPASSVNTVTNAASVSVTLAPGSGTTLSNFGTSGNVTIPVGYTFAVVCIGTTWFVQSAGPSDFAKLGALAVANGGTGAATAPAAITALGAADLSSAQTLTTKTLTNTSLTFDNLGTVTTAVSPSTVNGNVQQFTLGASVAVSAITGPGGSNACDLTLYIKQASSGGPFTISSWPGSVTWLGGSAPTIQAGSGAVTVVTFESLNGGTAWFGAQITGAPSLPLTVALGGTGATDSNDALAALAGQGVLSIFGNGNDGTVTFDGTTTILGMAPSSNVYTLTRDIMCTSITVSSPAIVRTSSSSGTFRIFCQGTVTVNSGGTITATGNAAGTAPAAGAGFASGSLVGGRAGCTGGAAGVAGTAPTSTNNASFGIAGGAGGAGGGGGGASGAGGSATIPGTSVVTNAFNTPFPLLTGICGYGGSALQIGFGAGGGGGGGATSNAGGGGGGGAGIVAIFAYNVIVNSGGTITAVGGAGHAGAGGNAGGGGGGAGGLIIAYTLSGWTLAGSTPTVVTGGAGGALSGSGTAGSAGGAGNVVNVVLNS